MSDTHSYVDDKVLKYVDLCDEVWHAGDIGSVELADQLSGIKLFRAVYGNIDDNVVRSAYPEVLRFSCEGVSVLMKHIGGYPGRYDKSIREELYRNPPKLFIAGHSHILKVIYDKKLDFLHINPGALGKNGFHKVRTLVMFSINNDNITDLEIVEWKRS